MPDNRPIYLDCNATTPIDPRVREVMLHYLDVEYGNAGSRTHVYGQAAAKGVKRARNQIAAVVDAAPEEIVFTSGATEANNLAILGLTDYGRRTGKRHIISTEIEHKAVLEPLKLLEQQGFEIELVPPTLGGCVDPSDIGGRLRDDTLLVSVMHVNNETGVIQPLNAICRELAQTEAFFHVDAAQGFGKELTQLTDARVDMISVSSHKVHGPCGIGSLIVRRQRNVQRALSPRQVGGNQERGLRSGTLPTFLICGFGHAAELAVQEYSSRRNRWQELGEQFRQALAGLPVRIHGVTEERLPNTCSFSLARIDSEAVLLALREVVALATGSACTSSRMEPSHVLRAMYPKDTTADTACRASWCHLTGDLPVEHIRTALRTLL